MLNWVAEQPDEASAPKGRVDNKEKQMNTGGPAFPSADFEQHEYTGMTLRDYFAAKAMQGMLSASENYQTRELARYAFDVADAMLSQREKS